MKYFLLLGALLSSFPCFATDFNFENNPVKRNEFVAWLRNRLNVKAKEDITINKENPERGRTELSLADALRFEEFLTSASFGDASWNVGVGKEIPVGESKVTFSAGALGDVKYTVTKVGTPRFGGESVEKEDRNKLPLINNKKLKNTEDVLFRVHKDGIPLKKYPGA